MEGTEQTEQIEKRECPHCMTMIDARARVCPQCGRAIQGADSKKLTIIILLVLGGLLFYYAILPLIQQSIMDDMLRDLSAPSASSYTIVYRVGGTANTADITMHNERGGTEQRTVNVPWETSFTVPAGQFLYLSAQSNDSGDARIRCTITANGREVQVSESEGRFVIASCSGTAGR